MDKIDNSVYDFLNKESNRNVVDPRSHEADGDEA